MSDGESPSPDRIDLAFGSLDSSCLLLHYEDNLRPAGTKWKPGNKAVGAQPVT